MSLTNTNPLIRVGDGVDAATLNKHGGQNALEVDSSTLLAVMNEVLVELKTIRELIASQL